MKRSYYDYTSRKRRVYTPTDLASVLARWQQAVATFQSLYETLSRTIAKRKQQSYTVTSFGMVYNGSQPPISELEQVRTGMLKELKRLLDDIDEPGNSTKDVNQATIRQLHNHTLQLQKQAQRIQQILDYD